MLYLKQCKHQLDRFNAGSDDPGLGGAEFDFQTEEDKLASISEAQLRDEVDNVQHELPHFVPPPPQGLQSVFSCCVLGDDAPTGGGGGGDEGSNDGEVPLSAFAEAMRAARSYEG